MRQRALFAWPAALTIAVVGSLPAVKSSNLVISTPLDASPKESSPLFVSLANRPDILNCENSYVEESAFDPGYNVTVPLNSAFIASDQNTPGARYGCISAARGDIFYTFKPGSDTSTPYYGDLVQAYVTLDVQLEFTKTGDGKYSGDVAISATMAPTDLAHVIDVGQRASRVLLNNLDVVAETLDTLSTKIDYSRFPELQTPASKTDSRNHRPLELHQIWCYGCVPPVLKEENEDPGTKTYYIYPYKTATQPIEHSYAPAPAVPLNTSALVVPEHRVVIVENMTWREDPHNPGLMIMEACGHITSNPASVLFCDAQTAFAAEEYATRNGDTTPRLSLSFVDVASGRNPQPQYPFFGGTIDRNIFAPGF